MTPLTLRQTQSLFAVLMEGAAPTAADRLPRPEHNAPSDAQQLQFNEQPGHQPDCQ